MIRQEHPPSFPQTYIILSNELIQSTRIIVHHVPTDTLPADTFSKTTLQADNRKLVDHYPRIRELKIQSNRRRTERFRGWSSFSRFSATRTVYAYRHLSLLPCTLFHEIAQVIALLIYTRQRITTTTAAERTYVHTHRITTSTRDASSTLAGNTGSTFLLHRLQVL